MIPVLHGVWAAAGGLVGDFEHIETVTVGAGGAASVTFSSIAGTYKHLQIRGIFRGTNASTEVTGYAYFNGNSTSTNYTAHLLYGDGSGAFASNPYNNGGAGQMVVGTGANASANIFGTFVTDILDYASTSKNKTMRSLYGYDTNGGGRVFLSSSLWMQTTAISSISIIASPGNLAQYSSFSLYGVK